MQVLKVDERGRVQTPLEKRQEIVAAYEQTGMTGKQFAAYCGVKYPTLMSWVKRFRKRKTGGKEVGSILSKRWVEAVVEQERAAEPEGLSVEMGTGVRLRVFNSRQAELAAAIIRCLGEVRPC